MILPVIDYAYTFEQPVFNGELGYVVNFTSLSRQTASYDAISHNAVINNWCGLINADTAMKISVNCLLRGMPGTYSRVSAETTWRSQYIDPVRPGDHAVRLDARRRRRGIGPEPDRRLELPDARRQPTSRRLMPTVGVEYRYPFVSSNPGARRRCSRSAN